MPLQKRLAVDEIHDDASSSSFVAEPPAAVAPRRSARRMAGKDKGKRKRGGSTFQDDQVQALSAVASTSSLTTTSQSSRSNPKRRKMSTDDATSDRSLSLEVIDQPSHVDVVAPARASASASSAAAPVKSSSRASTRKTSKESISTSDASTNTIDQEADDGLELKSEPERRPKLDNGKSKATSEDQVDDNDDDEAADPQQAKRQLEVPYLLEQIRKLTAGAEQGLEENAQLREKVKQKKSLLKEQKNFIVELDKSLASVRSAVSCRVCFQTMSDPYSLNCGHVFCRNCLQKWFLGSDAKGDAADDLGSSEDTSDSGEDEGERRDDAVEPAPRLFDLLQPPLPPPGFETWRVSVGNRSFEATRRAVGEPSPDAEDEIAPTERFAELDSDGEEVQVPRRRRSRHRSPRENDSTSEVGTASSSSVARRPVRPIIDLSPNEGSEDDDEVLVEEEEEEAAQEPRRRPAARGVPRADAHRGRNLNCPQCRDRVKIAPMRVFAISDVVAHIRTAERDGLFETDDDDDEDNDVEATTVEPVNDPTWGGLFEDPNEVKNMTLDERRAARATIVRDRDDGVRRCGVCNWEIDEHTGVCEGCGREWELSDDDEFQRHADQGEDETTSGSDSDSVEVIDARPAIHRRAPSVDSEPDSDDVAFIDDEPQPPSRRSNTKRSSSDLEDEDEDEDEAPSSLATSVSTDSDDSFPDEGRASKKRRRVAEAKKRKTKIVEMSSEDEDSEDEEEEEEARPLAESSGSAARRAAAEAAIKRAAAGRRRKPVIRGSSDNED